MAGLVDLFGGSGGPVTFGLGTDPSSLQPQPLVNNGAVNDTPLDILTKNFNPILTGNNWNAVLAALAAGDQINFQNAQYAFDQLFLSTASSPYLIQRASDQGVDYPTNI